MKAIAVTTAAVLGLVAATLDAASAKPLSLSSSISSGTKDHLLDLLTLVASGVEDLQQSQEALEASQTKLSAQLDEFGHERLYDNDDIDTLGRRRHQQFKDDEEEFLHYDLLQRLQRLERKLAGISSASNSENLYVEGCNLHIRDGSGSTHNLDAQLSNKGNLIVGYNHEAEPEMEPMLLHYNENDQFHNNTEYSVSTTTTALYATADGDAQEVCNLPEFSTDADLCEFHGGIWAASQTIGHHNVIVGTGHSYTHVGSLVLGAHHASVGRSTSLLGGHGHFAGGTYSSIAGGSDHVALAEGSTVLGGYSHVAQSDDATLVGGAHHTALDGSEAAALVGNQNHWATAESPFAMGEIYPIFVRDFGHARGDDDVLLYL